MSELEVCLPRLSSVVKVAWGLCHFSKGQGLRLRWRWNPCLVSVMSNDNLANQNLFLIVICYTENISTLCVCVRIVIVHNESLDRHVHFFAGLCREKRRKDCRGNVFIH